MKKLPIEVNSLIFEVTRKCNMACKHCLRGDAEKEEISFEVIDKVLEQVSHIDVLTITGGEPTLNVEAIKYIVSSIKKRGISVYDFFIATNGLVYSEELVLALIELYAYCMQYNGFDEQIGGLAVSLDEFHDEITSLNLSRYKALAFYSDCKEHKKNDDLKYLLNEGRANEYGIGRRPTNFDSNGLNIEYWEEDLIKVDSIYVNAKGDVVNDCDMSYESQEEFSLGKVLEKPLIEMIEADEEFLAFIA